MRVLIVDDDKTALLKMCGSIRQMGFDHVCHTDAREALKYAKAADIILVDWEMPDMNGIEFIQAAKSINVTAPIIIITGHRETEYVLNAIKYGADSFLEKPVNMYQEEVFRDSLYDKLNGVRYALGPH